MACVTDRGAVERNNVSFLDLQVIQLANQITRTLDQNAIAAVEAAGPASIAVSLRGIKRSQSAHSTTSRHRMNCPERISRPPKN
jgi:hypothetical protein